MHVLFIFFQCIISLYVLRCKILNCCGEYAFFLDGIWQCGEPFLARVSTFSNIFYEVYF